MRLMLASPSLAVIPAKAGTRGEHMDVLGFEERGIHGALMPKEKMDSRFRGNDGEKEAITKDTY
jgi:hypothetical protein